MYCKISCVLLYLLECCARIVREGRLNVDAGYEDDPQPPMDPRPGARPE